MFISVPREIPKILDILCFRLPVVQEVSSRVSSARLASLSLPEICDTFPPNITDITDPYVQEWFNLCRHEDYCNILDNQFEIELECIESSILELWGYDYDFTNITREEILEMVNMDILNGTFGPINLDTYMSPIRGNNGEIIGATSVTMTWLGETDVNAVTEEDLAAAEDGIAVRMYITAS